MLLVKKFIVIIYFLLWHSFLKKLKKNCEKLFTENTISVSQQLLENERELEFIIFINCKNIVNFTLDFIDTRQRTFLYKINTLKVYTYRCYRKFIEKHCVSINIFKWILYFIIEILHVISFFFTLQRIILKFHLYINSTPNRK